MLEKLLNYIRERRMIQAGDRVGIAVSGGADSVAALRAMLEVREELGMVLSVVHFDHKIRGREGEADAEFVAELATRHGLEFHHSCRDVPAFANKHHLSTEAAARRLRYEMFRKLLAGGALDKIATAHTRDDQAETVLLRVLRGAGTRGLAGIHPTLKLEQGAIIRPMLEISRAEVEGYLKSLDQPWREDRTNADVTYTRNRVRQQLLPLLERDYNPNIREVLSEMAEVAREEDAYWEELMKPLGETAVESEGGVTTVRFEAEAGRSLAVRRHLLRSAAESAGVPLDFFQARQVLDLFSKARGAQVELPRGWRAARVGVNGIAFTRPPEAPTSGYEYPVTIPGEIEIAPVRMLVRLTIVDGNNRREMYNPTSLLNESRLTAPLVLRNWRAGDRMRPLHRGSEEKLKRLFQEMKIPAEKRPLWPVLTSGDRVIWAKDLGVDAEFAGDVEQVAVKIEVEDNFHPR